MVILKGEHYEFMLKRENCLSDNIVPMCFYVIGVFANNLNSLSPDTKFNLMVSFNNELLWL